MRTKTLLMAGAALAFSLATSQAQVYSANIVGYANVVIAGNGGSSLIANPFDDGNGNQLTNLLTTLPNKSTVTTWNGTIFNPPISYALGAWVTNTSLPPGVGFFVKNGNAGSIPVTNTFVGNVLVNVGASCTNTLPAGSSLVGSQIPYVGDLTTDTNLNLYASLANKSTITTYANGVGYNPPVTFGGGVWVGTAPVIVGQGYFIFSKTATNWVQTLY